MITAYGNWQTLTPAPTCSDGYFDGGFFGGTAYYILCNGIAGSVTLSPQTTSKPLCIQDGSISGNLTFQINGPCSVGGFAPPPFGDNAFTVERTSDGFATYVQYDSNHAVNDKLAVSR